MAEFIQDVLRFLFHHQGIDKTRQDEAGLGHGGVHGMERAPKVLRINKAYRAADVAQLLQGEHLGELFEGADAAGEANICLLYTSDAADE